MSQERCELEYAEIKDARIFTEDHGIKTFYLTLAYEPPDGCCHQGAGGYSLDRFVPRLGKRVMVKERMEIVKHVADFFDVKDWKQLKGKGCYAVHTNGIVYAIGNMMGWLDFRAFFDERKERKLVPFSEIVRRYVIEFDGVRIL